MAQNTTLKTASIVLDTPAALATVLGHRQSTAVVVETSKPAAAEALGITLHKFNKWAEWSPETHPVAGDYPGTALWRDLNADDNDDAFSWWYLTDEGIPVEVPWGQHAEDEDEGDSLDGYDTLVDLNAPEGPQVLIASRHVSLEDELDMGMDEDDVAAVVEHLEEAREARDASPDVPGLDDDSAGLVGDISDEDWDHLTGKNLPTPNTDGVIVLDAKQTAALREREAAAAELTAMDDRALAAKIMARLNSQDPDDARKVIDMGGVQSQMWMAAAQVAREHFNA